MLLSHCPGVLLATIARLPFLFCFVCLVVCLGSVTGQCPCAAGMFCNTNCSPCPAGRYQAVTGYSGSSCTVCPVGKFSVGSAAACISCAAGSIAATTGRSVCTLCAANTIALMAGLSACADNNWDVNIPAGNTGKTWMDMKSTCSSKQQTLCTVVDLCPGGKPVAALNTFPGDNWMAVNDGDNQWLTYHADPPDRACQTHTQVAQAAPAWGTSTDPQGFARAAMCCGSPATPATPAACPGGMFCLGGVNPPLPCPAGACCGVFFPEYLQK
jgi:hypothetical protein